MPPDPFDLQGTTLDARYRVGQVVRQGASGVVYRAFDLRLDQPVALECFSLPAHFGPPAQARFADTLREEHAALSRLPAHPALVRVVDQGAARDPRGRLVPYLALDWIDGRTLDERLADRRPFPPGEAIALLRPIVDVLGLAHEKGIAHRRLTPASVLLADAPAGPSAKLLGFGVARAMLEAEGLAPAPPGSPSSAFSPAYAAAEQLLPDARSLTGPWTDVHALGLILVELVCGRRAYGGSQLGDLFAAARAEARPTPRALGVDVPPPFEALCARALARAPNERFANAQELRAAIDRLPAEGPRPPLGAGTVPMPLDDQQRAQLAAALRVPPGPAAPKAPPPPDNATECMPLDDALREQLRAAGQPPAKEGTEQMPMDDAMRAMLLSQGSAPPATQREPAAASSAAGDVAPPAPPPRPSRRREASKATWPLAAVGVAAVIVIGVLVARSAGNRSGSDPDPAPTLIGSATAPPPPTPAAVPFEPPPVAHQPSAIPPSSPSPPRPQPGPAVPPKRPAAPPPGSAKEPDPDPKRPVVLPGDGILREILGPSSDEPKEVR